MTVLVVAEHDGGRVLDPTFDAIAAARLVAKAVGGPVKAVLLGKGVDALAPGLLCDEALVVDDPALERYSSDGWIAALLEIAKAQGAKAVVAPHTSTGYDFAPALAVRLGAALATDCIRVSDAGGTLSVTRSILNGKVQSEVEFPTGAPVVLTTRQGEFQGTKEGTAAKVSKVPVKLDASQFKTRVLEVRKAQKGSVDITQAELIVSIGRGIGKKESLPVVKELADALGAALGASRPLTDLGWVEKERQVGTSGVTVKPKVYLAIGISGSVQHLAGMRTSDMIIAINKDPNAPIFKVAHYGVVGDLFQVVPALTKLFK